MIDSSVGPAGLFPPRRQRRLLDGLSHRIESSRQSQHDLVVRHADEASRDDQQWTAKRDAIRSQCRATRREMLDRWDHSEEELIHAYESDTITHRRELNRLAVIFRRRLADETKTIERKVQARREAVLQQYENRKHQPGQTKRKEIQRIDEALMPMATHLNELRAITIARLDRLPDVDPNEVVDSDDSDGSDGSGDAEYVAIETPVPTTITEAIATIGVLNQRAADLVVQMHSGVASKIIDRYYLPALVAVLVGLWALGAFFVAPDPPWIWMALGLIPCGLAGFVAYLIFLWPLKRSTRKQYPIGERIGRAAETCAATARGIATAQATESANDLVSRRDSHLKSASRWHDEQIGELTKRLAEEQTQLRQQLVTSIETTERAFASKLELISKQMRTKADEVAASITSTIASVDHEIGDEQTRVKQARDEESRHLIARLRAGVDRGLRRIEVTDWQVRSRFPDWEQVVAPESKPFAETVDFLPLGRLRIESRLRSLLSPMSNGDGVSNAAAADASWSDLLAGVNVPHDLHVALHRRVHSALVIHAASSAMGAAVDLTHQVLWRLLSASMPSRAKLTLIDPLGRGQHFTSFMALTDHDPAIVGHRVWTTDQKIEARLAELAHHVEDVLQSSLRDQFERIEDYNRQAGSMAEPYRAIAAVGFPSGLSREGHVHLRALVESGLRCGIFTILVVDDANPWPSDMPLPSGEKVLSLRIDAGGTWSLLQDGLDDLPLIPADDPPTSIRPALIERIGSDAVAASRVEIPLAGLLPVETSGTGSTADGISIVVGSRGANRGQAVQLGEGVRQHVLIAGKTGSGKSTLLHDIITSGSHHYTPDELQYYLLDFKKGVEFKLYADVGLPHARVIGIESEREFGRSVLQRLDAELQQRGEQFRAAGVQELGHFRDATGQAMPRIMLIVDEFQELFVRDDRIAGDCAMLLDRLVRQGRSFGMHVVLSSQSLAGAYSLPRATLGQMAVRIAMQCSEADAAMILSDDNTAARLISRPGEAIYNDAGGLIEGNQPFQVAWLEPAEHRKMLAAIAARDRSFAERLPPPVVFEGNRPCKWTPSLAMSALVKPAMGESSQSIAGLLGESVEIGPPIALSFSRNTGRNVLLIMPPPSRAAIVASTVSGFAKSDPRLSVVCFDGSRTDDGDSLSPWLVDAGIATQTVRPREAESEITKLADLVASRGDESEDSPPILVLVDSLERFRDLRQDESFSFSLDAATAPNGGASLQRVLRDGPPAGVFVMIVCGSAETLSRWLPRGSQHDLELRILGQMNPSDSSLLIDAPVAAELSAATMLVYDEADGRITKFRQCDLPDAEAVKAWLATGG